MAKKSLAKKSLAKYLCIRCHDQNRRLPWHKNPAKDRDWDERGRVACVVLFKSGLGFEYLHIDDSPPDDCPYILEQTLSRQ